MWTRNCFINLGHLSVLFACWELYISDNVLEKSILCLFNSIEWVDSFLSSIDDLHSTINL